MSSKWQELPFAHAFQDVTSKANKVDQRYFQDSGEFPIIDQGQSFIAAYLDDENLVWKGELPVIIFGDHTRAVKYVNFPFVLGADGAKVLKPHSSLWPMFGYYVLLNINIPSAGYSRHFKFLKENFIPLPPLDEQKRIATILSKADRLRRLRRYTRELSDGYLQSVFLEMFGDPVSNPRGWPTSLLGKIASVQRGRFSPRPRNDPKYYGGDYPFIQTGDIAKSNGFLSHWTQTLNKEGIRVSRAFDVGTVVIAIVGATIGETAILAISHL